MSPFNPDAAPSSEEGGGREEIERQIGEKAAEIARMKKMLEKQKMMSNDGGNFATLESAIAEEEGVLEGLKTQLNGI